MNRGHAWPIAVAVVLLLTVALNVVLVLEAQAPNGAVVEPDYYHRAVRWDSTLTQARTNAALGFLVDAGLESVAHGVARVRVSVRDRDGAPVDGAVVRIRALHNLDAGHPIHATLDPRGAGRYETTAPLARHGLWELDLEITRGATRFTADLRRDLATAEPRP
jgi:nitrogen fixation protein FixH